MLKLKLQYFGHLMRRADLLEKTLMLGKIEGRRRRGQQRMKVGWYHQLDGHKFDQAPGVGDGQGFYSKTEVYIYSSQDYMEHSPKIDHIISCNS